MTDTIASERNEEFAIIGMAGRFPGAPNIEVFWANIRDGVESIRRLTDDQLLSAGVSRTQLNDPDYVKACPVLDDVDKFDANFFGFSPREASVMDPAHRLFLEVAWEAVEHAGYVASPEEGPVGVFAGAGAPLYMIENLRSNPDLMHSMGEFLVRHTGNDMNFLATRVSYEMDLRGPSMNVQTACSSALVSVHLACQALSRGDCTLALAGGSTVLFPKDIGYQYKDGEILSPDGHCRPFDAKSAGTVFGSGAGVVVLKRLRDALDDGDTVHAVIKGSAINNDGAHKVSYLAPSVDGQAAVIRASLKAAQVPAESISYVETHGTGTLIGDPIEVEALNEAFRPLTNRTGFCAIGSVKSNIGHLGEAAGAASLIKAVMALKHRQLPPSLGFETPNPAIDFDNSPFFVNASLRNWESAGVLRCGVTALGAGGTNCHVILEEAPPALPGEGERTQQLLVLSAATPTALDTACENLAAALERDPDLDLADAAFTLAAGRRALTHRRALAVGSCSDAIARLRERNPKSVVTDSANEARPKTVFMFPGGGAQYAGMGQELYDREDVYREAVDACLEIIAPALDVDLRALMFPRPEDVAAATRILERPSLTLPSLFATEYALGRLFQSWGVAPDAFIGHSVGEYAAACFAGVMSLEDTVQLVMMRGRLFEVVDRGSMLSVPMGETDLRAILPAGLDIAAANAADLSVASGPTEAIEKLEALLAGRDIESTRVRIDVAAHSAMLDPVLGQFRDLCRTIRFQPPKIPFVSNVTGKWITAEEATSPEYWVRHLRSTVRFADGLATLKDLGAFALLEAGPGRTLSMLAKAQAAPMRQAFNCMRHPQETGSDLAHALTGIGRLWCAGAQVDWSAFYDGQLRNRVPLPTYPFERQSYWVEPGKSHTPAAARELVKRAEIGEWFYSIGYVEAPAILTRRTGEARTWLLLSENARDARELARALGNEKTLIARPGKKFGETLDGTWTLDWDNPEHYTALLNHMREHVGLPDHVVMLTSGAKAGAGPDAAERAYFHPLYLVQALGELTEPVQVSIVTSGVSGVGGRSLDPVRSLALGPALVAPREFDHLSVRCIDLPDGRLSAASMRPVLAGLVRDLRAESPEQVIALEADRRWVQRISPTPLPPVSDDQAALDWVRTGGAYLITGGLGGIGLEVAERIAKKKPVRLALLSREPLPPEARWDEILAGKSTSRAAARIAKVRELRSLGAEVRVVSADVANEAALSAAVADVRLAWGPLNGVIHAAGVLDDAPMMTKSAASMRELLAPKVAGTLALDKIVTEDLDVFLLFSSVASCLGLPGQVDYTAANAFQDAFARSRAARKPGRTVVVNWNAWRDVGMAANAHTEQSTGVRITQPSLHPAFDGYSGSDASRTFVAALSTDNNWMLAEHIVKDGPAVLPGTGFVELARAAYSETVTPGPVVLSGLTFIAPFRVAPGESRVLTVEITAAGDHHAISVRAGGDRQSQPIAVGEARPLSRAAPGALDMAEIRARCSLREISPEGGRLAQDFMAFGPRWANIRKIAFGKSEAVMDLSLDAAFEIDLPAYGLHPALLDMATGGAQALIPGFDPDADFYVPMAYGSMSIWGPMPAAVTSHVRCLPDSDNGLAYFDVTLCDAQGNVFAEISRFTMRRLDTRTSLTSSHDASVAAAQRQNSVLSAALQEGIAADEGFEALDRIMAQPGIIQAAVCSVDLQAWQQQLGADRAKPAEQTAELEGFQRPGNAANYIAPRTLVEVGLAKIWSDLLGVRNVGVNDNFFDLGGNSLSGVRLFAAIRRQFQVSLPLAILFEASTIADLAALLPSSDTDISSAAAPEAQGEWSPLVRIKAGSPGQRPFFFIHGSRGNVLLFKSLADKFGPEQPFYALQAAGVDGKLPPDETIGVMATRYLAAIRKVQPLGPYMIAGYSGGGVIAYEIARLLKQTDERVDILMLVDTLEPEQFRSPISTLDRIRNLHRIKPYRFAQMPRLFWKYTLQPRIRKMMSVEEIAAPRTALELASQAVDDAYYRAQHAYHTEPLETDAVLIRATDARMAFLRSGPWLGWDKFVKGKIHLIDVDAEHDHVFNEPSVSQLAAGFKALLAEQAASIKPVEPVAQDVDLTTDRPQQVLAQTYAKPDGKRERANADQR